MLTFIIAIAIAACAASFLIGLLIGAGSRAESDSKIITLKTYLRQIIASAEEGFIDYQIIQKVRKILDDE